MQSHTAGEWHTATEGTSAHVHLPASNTTPTNAAQHTVASLTTVTRACCSSSGRTVLAEASAAMRDTKLSACRSRRASSAAFTSSAVYENAQVAVHWRRSDACPGLKVEPNKQPFEAHGTATALHIQHRHARAASQHHAFRDG